MYNYYHFTRTLLISKKNPNLLVVTVGSNDNIDQASFQKATGRAAIKVFDLRTLPSGGTPFNNSQYGKYMGYA
jgi:glucose/arabinose dehydrogenase